MIKLWIHDGSLYMEPHWIADSKAVFPGIREWGRSILSYAKEHDKQHCVYATREVDSNGITIEVNYYCVCLDDEDFNKRTDTVIKQAHDKGNELVVYAFHKGISY